MTEHDDKQPLTRRERRLRELGETGALDLSEAVTRPAAEQKQPQGDVSGSATEVAPAAEESDEIVIDPLNPDGTPRSRREIRALREQAMAERAHARSEAAGVDAAVASGAEAVQEEASAELAEADAAPHSLQEAAKVEEEVLEDGVNEQPGADLPAVDTPDAGEAAAAETDSQAESASADEEPAEPETVAVPKVDASAAAPKADAEPEPDFDSLIAPPTEAYNVDELREAEQVSADPDSEDAIGAADEVEQDAAAEEADSEEPAAAEAAPAAEAKPKRRFWQRGRAAEETSPEDEEPAEDPTTDESDAAAAPAADSEDAPAEDAAKSAEEPDAVAEPTEAEEPAAEPVPAPRPATRAQAPQPPAAPEPAAKPEAKQEKEGYSFPDTAPPEEWRSVFDDHSSRAMPTQPKADGDFDDLISRAVAQEGSTASSTSALILPNMPEDTGGLTGPLGATGDLYVTGSLKLPKSLGETGGHSALHDSVEIDPITGGAAADETAKPGDGPAPVAARHAVSARVSTGANVVAKPAKEKSKLPLILSLTGGGLLVVVVGIGVWGASNGMFG
ncbi:hypothetical protein JD292_05125 [Leucobacter sp. CSA2]|uniref:Uncharacterized protein n=1 Tax=Leucobacter edaphi TaxID=2796472 RepID=A0A934QC48_9MICO|nr:hypothetical protein [Leucobacter edaphi]MBK0421453.1 hypothetical protein [Leucobacter edaphi]